MGFFTSEVQKLYVAYFSRPADPTGLTYWEAQITSNGGSVAAVVNAFSTSPEYKSLYAGKSSAQIVDAIYLNLFGRSAEPAGLDYWGKLLDNRTLDIGNIVLAIMSGAQNADKLVVANRLAAAALFTQSLDSGAEINAYSSSAATAAAKAWLATVTDSADTLKAATASVGTVISTIVTMATAAPVADTPAESSQTFSLTTGADTFTGAGAGDLFLAGSATLSTGDILNGGGGTDVLSISASGQSLVGVTLTSIEEIRIADFSTLSVEATALGTVAVGHGATTDVGDVVLAIDLAGAAAFDLSRVTAGQAGTASSAIKALYTNKATTASNVTLTGLADNFTGSADADTINAGAGNDTVNGGAGADTIDGGAGDDRINYTIAQDIVNGGLGTDTLVIAGGALSIDLTATTGAITNFEVIDASAATVFLTTTVATNPATTTAFKVVGTKLADNITTGAGDDIITMGEAGQTVARDTIVAAGGNDTLVIVGTMTTGSVTQNVIDLNAAGDQFALINNGLEGVIQSGFENLDLSGLVPDIGLGFTVTAASGGSKIAGTTLADSITGAAGNDTIFGFYGSDTVSGGGGTDDTLVLINGGTAGLFTATNVQGNAVVISTDGGLTGVETITVSGSTSMTLDLTGQAEAFVISAGTATAAETLIAGSGNDTLTGSSLADAIEGGLGADTMTGGTGADTFRFSNNGSVVGTSMDVITDFAAGSDILNFSTTAVLRAADATALIAGICVQQSAGGLVAFAAADNTLALKIAAIQSDFELDDANSLAFFVDGGNSYVYFAGNASGDGDDMIIQLTGVTTLTTITAGASSTIA